MILFKTEAGQQAFRDRTIRLTPRQRSAFILCDGKRSIEEVQAAGMSIERSDLEQMVELGMLAALGGATATQAEPQPQPQAVPAAVFTAPTAPVVAAVPQAATVASGERTAQQRYKDAYPIATRLSSGLGLRGFRLNLSIEGATSYEELLALAPKIRAAVGPDKAAELDRALIG